MKKTPNNAFVLGALGLSLAACSPVTQARRHNPLQNQAPLAEELKPLQGHWEGEGAGGKCSITIAGNSLHYRNSAGWYKTTFTLPAGTDPQQMHATIKECSPPSSNAIGTVVFAIFKIEDATLILAEDDMSEKPPKTFHSASSRYVLKQVQPHQKNIEPPKTK